MPLYEIVIDQVYFGQQCINRFNYFGSGTPASVSGSFALTHAMGFIKVGDPPSYSPDTIFAKWRNLVSTSVAFSQVIVKDVYSVTDFYGLPFLAGEAGLAAGGAPSSPTEAYGFRTNRVRSDIRRATKRFAGVEEAGVDPGGVIASAAYTTMTILATALSQTLTYDDEGTTITFQPAVVKKEKYTAPSGNDAYRYPAIPPVDLQDICALGILWQPYTQVRTQTSRQYGHGS